jgi:hypothetical protein
MLAPFQGEGGKWRQGCAAGSLMTCLRVQLTKLNIYIYTFQLGQTQIHDSNLSMPCKKVMAFASLVINVTLIP